MNEEAMRKAFEALCEKRWAGSRGVFALRDDGEYENGNVQFGWVCYKSATRAAVPAGCRSVPMEPTPKMINDAHVGLGSCMGSCGEASPPDASDIAYALRCAIAAAPELKP